MISDAHFDCAAAIREVFPVQVGKVRFVCNMLAHVLHKEKNVFAQLLKAVQLIPTREQAYRREEDIYQQHERRFPKVICCLEVGLEGLLAFYALPPLDDRKIFFTNVLKRLNREIWRRTNVAGFFPNPKAYTRLVATYLMEYAEQIA